MPEEEAKKKKAPGCPRESSH